MRSPGLILFAALLTTVGPAAAQSTLDPFDRFIEPPDLRLVAPHSSSVSLEYGPRRWEEIEYFAPRSDEAAPLVVIFATRGRRGSTYADIEWVRHRSQLAGYAVAMIPTPERADSAAVRDANYTSAMAFLRERADSLGFDPTRIVIAGFDQATLAMRMGTDPDILEEGAGFAFESLRGVVIHNGSIFDLEAEIGNGTIRREPVERYYGSQPDDLARNSPTFHIGDRDAPRFLLLADEDARYAVSRSRDLAARLEEAETQAEYVMLPRQRAERPHTFAFVTEEGSGKELMAFLAAAYAD